jgi:hypothetical protein
LLAICAFSLWADSSAGKVLFIYDEVNQQSSPYVERFREAFAAKGISFDEATAVQVKSKDLSSYTRLVVYGMVMAFNMKSPVRDWLKTAPDLSGKRISLFVTANRWFLQQLVGQLTDLLKKDKAEVVDAVSMATKDLDVQEKSVAVDRLVKELK